MEELTVDTPKAPQLLSHVVTNAVLDKLLTVDCLKVLESFDDKQEVNAFAFVASVFRQLKQLKDQKLVLELYQQSGLDMMKFLPAELQNADELMELLNEEGLRFLTSS